MVAKNQAARGEQNRTFNVFPKLGQASWGGMIPDGNPASLPQTRPRLVINGRYQNGQIEARGGQSVLENGLPEGDVTSLLDVQPVSRRTLYIVSFGCPGEGDPGLGFAFLKYDYDDEPAFQPAVYKFGTQFGFFAEPYGEDLVIAADNRISKFVLIEQGYGQSALAIGGSEQDALLFELPSPLTHVHCMRSFDGRLFIGCNGGSGTSRVIAFDGRTFMDDVGALEPPQGMGVFRETLLMGFSGTPNQLWIRAAGTPPGTWTQAAPTGGTFAWGRTFTGDGAQAAGSSNGAGCSYRDRFWIASGSEDVFMWDGTTLTQVTPATTGIGAAAVTVAFCILEITGVPTLCLLYEDASGDVKIQGYDGSSWVLVKNISTVFVGSFTLDRARNMAAYRGSPYVLARSDDAGTFEGRLLAPTNAKDPGGSWDEIVGVGQGATDLGYLLVF